MQQNNKKTKGDDRDMIESIAPTMKLKKILLIAVVAGLFVIALFAGLANWFGLSFGAANPAGPSKYSAVYLSTGDIYYGELSWFPAPHLSKALLLQRGTDENNQPQISVVPFKSAFWGPVGDVHLNPKQIIFWAKLRNDSQIVKLIENPDSLSQGQPQQQGESGQTTSTPR